ncbi:ras association domain-containing protein 9 [Nematolebias whitei]|uniref:ras association domain-containing protein 9 n=1 Tax=Nematolebias whitei TaxID=451745 RepID=UPI0018975183|nr:ras association domain-containing protein 9 [Nematolebias whitei]
MIALDWTKDAEPVVGKEIQVTVCNEEKVVCGVTKHTTCADMIQALLEDHKTLPESKRLMHGDPKDFCLVERWKGFERALPPLTRILRLWYAWGDQRPFIQFVLVKTSDFVPHTAKKGGKYKGMKPKRWDSNPTHAHPLPADKQKRLVKKAFRKLEKLHKESRSSPGAEEVKRMVQLILNQDHTIREQIQRMRDVDVEIEQFELEMQKQTNSEIFLPPACDQSLAAHSKEQLEKYLYTSDGVEQLDLQIQLHQEFILQLSLDIHAELKSCDLLVQDEKGATAAPQFPFETDEFYTADLERLQEELRRSLFSGVALQNQAAEIDKQLKSVDCSLVAKEQECWQLASQLNSIQIMDCMEEQTPVLVPLKSEAQCGVPPAAALKHCLSPLDVTDTDSDTGISSTHSQDSLSPNLDFPSPLDSDV